MRAHDDDLEAKKEVCALHAPDRTGAERDPQREPVSAALAPDTARAYSSGAGRDPIRAATLSAAVVPGWKLPLRTAAAICS